LSDPGGGDLEATVLTPYPHCSLANRVKICLSFLFLLFDKHILEYSTIRVSMTNHKGYEGATWAYIICLFVCLFVLAEKPKSSHVTLTPNFSPPSSFPKKKGKKDLPHLP